MATGRLSHPQRRQGPRARRRPRPPRGRPREAGRQGPFPSPLPDGSSPLGTHSWGVPGVVTFVPAPRAPRRSGPGPPTRPDAWKLPEGRPGLAATPGPACPPTPQLPHAPRRPAPAPNVLKDVLRSPDLHDAGGPRGVRAAVGHREVKKPLLPPPRPSAAPAAAQCARAIGPDARDVPTRCPTPYPGLGSALALRAAQRSPAP